MELSHVASFCFVLCDSNSVLPSIILHLASPWGEWPCVVDRILKSSYYLTDISPVKVATNLIISFPWYLLRFSTHSRRKWASPKTPWNEACHESHGWVKHVRMKLFHSVIVNMHWLFRFRHVQGGSGHHQRLHETRHVIRRPVWRTRHDKGKHTFVFFSSVRQKSWLLFCLKLDLLCLIIFCFLIMDCCSSFFFFLLLFLPLCFHIYFFHVEFKQQKNYVTKVSLVSSFWQKLNNVSFLQVLVYIFFPGWE